MEDRKLNFSAPLISARRFTVVNLPIDRIHSQKIVDSHDLDANSDLPVKAVAIPFYWEQIPGLPKDGGMLRSRSCELAPKIPRTDPRKIFDVLKQRVERKHSSRSLQRSSTVVDSYKSKLELSKERMACGKVFPSCHNDEETEEVYSEANDTMSIAEAFSLICSASGVSNCDSAVVKDSGTFSTDKQVQDFMMSRFLPAAKAMALQPSLSASKKLPAVVEQERQVSRVVSMERKPAALLMDSVIASSIPNEDDDFEDDKSSVSVQVTSKVCGLLPRLCLKSSLSFFNPVPGFKLRCKSSAPSSPEPVKLSSDTKRSGSPFRKIPSISSSNPRQDLPPQPPRLLEDAKKLKFGSNQFNSGSERPSMSRTSSPLRRSGVLSPRRSRSPQRPFRGDSTSDVECSKPNKLPAYRGGIKSQDLTGHHVTKQWSCPLIPAIEKTLYIDGVNKPEKLLQASGKNINGPWRSRELPPIGAKKSFESAYFPASERQGNFFRSRELTKYVEDRFANDPKTIVRVGSDDDYDNLEDSNDWSSKGIDSGVNVAPPAPPVLPKSPSESWLWRTLPSMPPRNSFNHFNGKSFQSKWEDSSSSPEEAKWENIVKAAYLHRDRARYSEELVLSASMQLK